MSLYVKLKASLVIIILDEVFFIYPKDQGQDKCNQARP